MNWCFFGWRDVIEIFFFFTVFYYFSLFLKTDTKNNLLIYFYLYGASFFTAHYLQLTTIQNFFILTAPACIMLFILFHQKFLQRNFVTLKKKQSALVSSYNWLEILIRSCLVGINDKKDILCIIEHTDTIDDYFTTIITCNTPLHSDILAFLIKSPLLDSNKYIVSTSNGLLKGFNADINNTLHDVWIDQNIKNIPTWQQHALQLSQYTDAIIFKSHADQHAFTLIIQNTIYTHVDTHNTIKLISHYVRNKKVPRYEGASYGITSNKDTQSEYQP